MVSACSQLQPKSSQEDVFSFTLANLPHGYPVDSRAASASIGGDPPPGAPQIAWVNYPVPQIAVRFSGVGLAPLVQLPLHAEQPGFRLLVRVHGPLLRRQRLTDSLPPFAMCAAFPRSDYYEGSVLVCVLPRSPRIASLRRWRTPTSSHVPTLDLWTFRRHALPLPTLEAQEMEAS